MPTHLLVDIDSVIPNLALMKIATWAKSIGDHVDFMKPTRIPDHVWISCVFTWNRGKAFKHLFAIKSFWPNVQIHIGGTGIDHGKNRVIRSYLPQEIEAQKPDYSLYPLDDRAIGFCRRGCNRKCQFCDVPLLEGLIGENTYQPLGSWVPPSRNKVVLLDNNLAENPHHDDILSDAHHLGLKLCISQGYDVRHVTPERASLLNEDKPWSLKFDARRLYIAWDYFFIEPAVIKGIEMLLDAGFKGREIMCYCLTGFNTSESQDLHRVNILASYGVLPYIMPYNRGHEGCKDASRVMAFARWVNRRYYKFVSWETYDYNPGNVGSLV